MPSVMTGKKSSPTAACSHGIAGPLCRWGYKYGGLAFQFGGGQQADNLSP